MVTDELVRAAAFPAPAAQEPAYATWRGRPYGHLPAPHLTARQAEEQAAARRAEGLAEAARATRASAEALREAGQTLAAYPHTSLLAPDGTWTPPRDAQAMAAVLEAMRHRVPELAARMDAGLAEDARQLRADAEAQRSTAARHRACATGLRQGAALREEMRTAAPVHHAHEAEERAVALRGGQDRPLPPQAPVPAPASAAPLRPALAPTPGDEGLGHRPSAR
ncbi:hypothetical protein [Streptomyces sp. NPDC059411]|uniref:hypothetical protein n=1 Tax=Streptomyces sp. NPDC059411 TaxID=3346825 RepID=UPI00367922AE